MIPRVTLDTNCILDLEEDTPPAVAVRDLVARHDRGSIVLSIPSIMASERQREGVYFDDFAQFVQRLAGLGIDHLPLLPPMAYVDICFFDHSLMIDDAMESLELQVHRILHPHVEYEYADYCARHGIDPAVEPLAKAWRNRKCDVQVVWTHIHHRGDLLVTSDKNFLKASKLPHLLALGAGAIVEPEQAAASLAPAV